MKKRKCCTLKLNVQLKQQMLRQIAVNQGDPWSASLHMHSDSASLFLFLYQSQRSMENLRLNRTSVSNRIPVDCICNGLLGIFLCFQVCMDNRKQIIRSHTNTDLKKRNFVLLEELQHLIVFTTRVKHFEN